METQDDQVDTQIIEGGESLSSSNHTTTNNDGLVIAAQTADDDSISLGSIHNNGHSNTGATPFLNKLVDPFAESPLTGISSLSPSAAAFQTPTVNKHINLAGMMSNKLTNMTARNPNEMFSKMRRKQQDVEMLDYDSESQLAGIRIEEGDQDHDHDHDHEDSFKLDDDTYSYNNNRRYRSTNGDTDTQIIDGIQDLSDTPVLNLADTQLVQDTQLVSGSQFPESGHAKTSVNSNDNYQVPPTQRIMSSSETYQIPSTQLIKRSIEVPSTVEKSETGHRADLFDEITSQQSIELADLDYSSQQHSVPSKLNFSKTQKIEVGSDMDVDNEEEIQNTTFHDDLIEVTGSRKVDVEEEEGDSHSNKFLSGFPEDSLKIYDQLRLKRRQFSDLDLISNKKSRLPKLPRTRTDIQTPFSMKMTRDLSSPSAEIPNSSPSLDKQKPRLPEAQHQDQPQDGSTSMIQSSPTAQVIRTSPEIRASSSQSPIKSTEKVTSSYSNEAVPVADASTVPQQNDGSSASQPGHSTPESASSQSIYRKDNDELSHLDIVHPSSVWARILDKFHPTIIRGTIQDGFLILHQEKEVNLQGSLNVFPLDIKIGDRIKILSRKKVHCVTGLAAENGPDPNTIKCVRGYDTVYAMPCVRNEIDHESDEEKFPLSQIYLVSSIWNKRNFIKYVDTVEFQTGLVSQLPPRIRGRNNRDLLELSPHKSKLANHHDLVIMKKQILQPDFKNSSGLMMVNEESSHNATSNSNFMAESGILKDCVFTITSTPEPANRENLQQLILSHGGRLLQDGFNELFTRAKNGLQLSKSYQRLRFALLISSKGYCRSLKYLELLLLGWPIVSDQFLVDLTQGSISIENFEPYLLPAGESNLLNGEIKSLSIYSFKTKFDQGLFLEKQFKNNKFFKGVNVLKFLGDSSLQTSAKSKISSFLFRCLDVEQMTDCKSKDALLDLVNTMSSSLSQQDQHKLVVYVNEFQKSLGLDWIKAEFLKRKPKRRSAKSRGLDQSLQVTIVDWEWLVQCVITGTFLKSEWIVLQ